MRITSDHYRHFVCAIVHKTFDKLFVCYILLWCLSRLLRWNQITLPFINNWLADFLFVPVVAHLSLSFTRYIILRNPAYNYPLSYLLFIAAYASIVFEYILPMHSLQATRDLYDVLAYFLGSLYYYYAHGKQSKVTGKT